MKQHGLWCSHKIYKSYTNRNLAEDLIDLNKKDVLFDLRNAPSFLCDRYTIKYICESVLYRYCRLKKVTRISKYNEIAKIIAYRISGNQDRTYKAIKIENFRDAFIIYKHGFGYTPKICQPMLQVRHKSIMKIREAKNEKIKTEEKKTIEKSNKNLYKIYKIKDEIYEINKQINQLKKAMKNEKHNS